MAGSARDASSIVDDNADTARGMTKLIRLVGHDRGDRPRRPRGHRARQALSPPEQVLLDIGLQGMDGDEVTLRTPADCRSRLAGRILTHKESRCNIPRGLFVL